MREWLRQWWRYPFAVAGPISAAYYGLLALTGVLSALLLRPSLAILPGAVVYGIGSLKVTRARRRFLAKRDIAYYKWNLPGRIRLEGASGVVALVVLVVVIGLRWNPGWLWVLGAVGVFGVEFHRRQTWARAGYPGDPRWRTDWSPEQDPAYEWIGLSRLLSAKYPEAMRLFRLALETKPTDRTILYNLACAEALAGEREAALEHVNQAVIGEKKHLKLAQKDPSFASIRDDPRFPVAESP